MTFKKIVFIIIMVGVAGYLILHFRYSIPPLLAFTQSTGAEAILLRIRYEFDSFIAGNTLTTGTAIGALGAIPVVGKVISYVKDKKWSQWTSQQLDDKDRALAGVQVHAGQLESTYNTLIKTKDEELNKLRLVADQRLQELDKIGDNTKQTIDNLTSDKWTLEKYLTEANAQITLLTKQRDGLQSAVTQYQVKTGH